MKMSQLRRNLSALNYKVSGEHWDGKNSQVINIFFYVELFFRSVFSVPFFLRSTTVAKLSWNFAFLAIADNFCIEPDGDEGEIAPESCKITLRN